MVEVDIAGKGKSMGKFELGRAPSFECHVLTSWERKTPRAVCQFGLMHYVLIFGFIFWELRDVLLSIILHSGRSSGVVEFFLCVGILRIVQVFSLGETVIAML